MIWEGLDGFGTGPQLLKIEQKDLSKIEQQDFSNKKIFSQKGFSGKKIFISDDQNNFLCINYG